MRYTLMYKHRIDDGYKSKKFPTMKEADEFVAETYPKYWLLGDSTILRIIKQS